MDLFFFDVGFFVKNNPPSGAFLFNEEQPEDALLSENSETLIGE